MRLRWEPQSASQDSPPHSSENWGNIKGNHLLGRYKLLQQAEFCWGEIQEAMSPSRWGRAEWVPLGSRRAISSAVRRGQGIKTGEHVQFVLCVPIPGFLQVRSRVDFEEGERYRQMEKSGANDVRKCQQQDSATRMCWKKTLAGTRVQGGERM